MIRSAREGFAGALCVCLAVAVASTLDALIGLVMLHMDNLYQRRQSPSHGVA